MRMNRADLLDPQFQKLVSFVFLIHMHFYTPTLIGHFLIFLPLEWLPRVRELSENVF